MGTELWLIVGVLGAGGLAGGLWLLNRDRKQRDLLRESLLRLGQLKTQRHLALVEEQSKQQALLDSMVEGVLVLDENGRVEHVNPALVRLFGLTREIRGQPCRPAPEIHSP